MKRWLRLWLMVLWGILMIPTIYGAAAEREAFYYFSHEEVSDQEVLQAVHEDWERPQICEDGRIILWDEWSRSTRVGRSSETEVLKYGRVTGTGFK